MILFDSFKKNNITHVICFFIFSFQVCLQRGTFEGFGDEPIELIGNGAGVDIRVTNRRQSGTNWFGLQVTKNNTTVSQVKSFQIKDPINDLPIFSTDFPNFGLPQGVDHIELEVAQTHRLVAPKKNHLNITSGKDIYLHGAEGTSLDSRDVVWTATNGILLKSRNGDVVFDAKDGIEFLKLPTAIPFDQSNETKQRYKVCVCMPDGKLFFISSMDQDYDTIVDCAKVSRSMDKDPCVS